jgi:hypothetical protein
MDISVEFYACLNNNLCVSRSLINVLLYAIVIIYKPHLGDGNFGLHITSMIEYQRNLDKFKAAVSRNLECRCQEWHCRLYC